MQTPRRLLAVLAALSVALMLATGCTITKKSAGGNLPDGATLVKQAAESAKGVKSAHIVLTVNGKIPGLSIKMLSGDLNTEPTAAKGTVKLTFSGSDVDADFVVFDGILYAALTPNNWTAFGKAADVYDPSQILSQDKGVANVLANFTDGKAQGRDEINGQPTIRISGNTTAAAVNAIAPPFSASAPVPTTLWIQENGDHQLVQAKLERGAGNWVQMTLSNWGQPVQVTKPAE